MKPIPLPIAELKSALSGIGKVINPRTTLPVLQHVKVERTNDGWIALTGTDPGGPSGLQLAQSLRAAAASVLGPGPIVWHFHNHSLGRGFDGRVQ